MIRSLGQSLRLEGGNVHKKICSSILGLRLTIFLHNCAGGGLAWNWQNSQIQWVRKDSKLAVTRHFIRVLSCCSLVYDRNNSSCLDTGASLLLAICTARYCVDIGISTHRSIHDMIIISMLRRYDCVLAGHLYKRCADSNKWLVRWFRLYQVLTLVSSS